MGVRVTQGKITVNVNPGKNDFGLSYCEVRVSEGSIYQVSTVQAAQTHNNISVL